MVQQCRRVKRALRRVAKQQAGAVLNCGFDASGNVDAAFALMTVPTSVLGSIGISPS
jgi:monoamine oxidase